MKNTGKQSEGNFEDLIRKLGKKAYLLRLLDRSDVKGSPDMPKQPCDYVLVNNGNTAFVEIKSTVSTTGFRKSNIKKTQSAAAERILKAGGSYLFFIYSIAKKLWYCVPLSFILSHQKSEISWRDLDVYRFDV